MRKLMGINGEKFLFLEHELFTNRTELMGQCGKVTCPDVPASPWEKRRQTIYIYTQKG